MKEANQVFLLQMAFGIVVGIPAWILSKVAESMGKEPMPIFYLTFIIGLLILLIIHNTVRMLRLALEILAALTRGTQLRPGCVWTYSIVFLLIVTGLPAWGAWWLLWRM